jgi:beta-mannosidase
MPNNALESGLSESRRLIVPAAYSMKTNTLLILFLMATSVSSGGFACAAGVVRLDLGGAWQVTREGMSDAIPVTVPGCIHTDLLAAKKIPDPFYRDNEKLVQWVGEANWIYRRSFDLPPEFLAHDRVVLKCDGLDTLATIRVNGTEVARTDNMFRSYEFDVKKLLKPIGNTIEIRFDSVLPLMRTKESQRKLPTWNYPGSSYVRKEPCNFGWDWGPTLITCGIWRPISLLAFDKARITDVAITQDHSHKGKVKLNVEIAYEGSDAAMAHVDASLGKDHFFGGSDFDKSRHGTAYITIDDPKLWWPAGMGAQPLYTIAVTLEQHLGVGSFRTIETLDSTTRRIGLRTLRAVPQTAAMPLHLEANGVPFFAKGANWIPADSFANRLSKDVLRRYVDDAAAVNMNTLRFWGGGYYEDDAFFDCCDERGICVWMDFKFACSSYPSFDEAFLQNAAAEARDNILRLRHHPSIALWCGNNEIMFFRGGKEWTADKMSENDYYKLFRDTLGGEIRRLAPQSDYVTGSPDCGDVHYWQVWHGGKPFEDYRNIHGFVSEFGFQSFAQPKTVRAFTAAGDRQSIYSSALMQHERSNRGYFGVKEDGRIGTDKIMIGVRKYFREPKDFESTLWLSQITQGFGIKYAAEGWRREAPRSMGCVYWQYNDCWPCTSWSSVDYFGRWKALHYLSRRFYAPLLVCGEADAKGESVDLWVASDRRENCRGSLKWSITDLCGAKLDAGSFAVDIAAGKSRFVRSLDLAEVIKKHGRNNLLVWLKLEVAGRIESENLVTLAYPKELKLLDPGFTAEVTATQPGEFSVTLHAAHPALWTWLELDGADARFSDNFIHVSPTEPVTIVVRPAEPMTANALRRVLKIRSLYDTYR